MAEYRERFAPVGPEVDPQEVSWETLQRDIGRLESQISELTGRINAEIANAKFDDSAKERALYMIGERGKLQEQLAELDRERVRQNVLRFTGGSKAA